MSESADSALQAAHSWDVGRGQLSSVAEVTYKQKMMFRTNQHLNPHARNKAEMETNIQKERDSVHSDAEGLFLGPRLLSSDAETQTGPDILRSVTV
ncbi:hypothetical protein ABVT39_011036 [Epinephelus coioides]